VSADMRYEDDVRNLVGEIVSRFGRLEVAVNEAGTEGKPGTITERSAESLCGHFRQQRPWHAAEHEAIAHGLDRFLVQLELVKEDFLCHAL
jgi:NAD(P)-dependent dehydrogenase (short-subunit alcohol dehydrogenase family)